MQFDAENATKDGVKISVVFSERGRSLLITPNCITSKVSVDCMQLTNEHNQ